MPTGKTKRTVTKNASAASPARSTTGKSKGTSKKSTKREDQPSQGKSDTDEADITTRPRGGNSAVEGETQPDGEGNESDFWVKRPRGG